MTYYQCKVPPTHNNIVITFNPHVWFDDELLFFITCYLNYLPIDVQQSITQYNIKSYYYYYEYL